MIPENQDVFLRVMVENGCDAGYAASALLDADPIPLTPHHLLAIMNAVRAEERARAVEVVKPFAAIFAEHREDLAPEDSRHAWGFNGGDLYWRDFRRAAAYVTDNPEFLAKSASNSADNQGLEGRSCG